MIRNSEHSLARSDHRTLSAIQRRYGWEEDGEGSPKKTGKALRVLHLPPVLEKRRDRHFLARSSRLFDDDEKEDDRIEDDSPGDPRTTVEDVALPQSPTHTSPIKNRGVERWDSGDCSNAKLWVMNKPCRRLSNNDQKMTVAPQKPTRRGSITAKETSSRAA